MATSEVKRLNPYLSARADARTSPQAIAEPDRWQTVFLGFISGGETEFGLFACLEPFLIRERRERRVRGAWGESRENDGDEECGKRSEELACPVVNPQVVLQGAWKFFFNPLYPVPIPLSLFRRHRSPFSLFSLFTPLSLLVSVRLMFVV